VSSLESGEGAVGARSDVRVDGLSDRDRAVLDFEREWGHHAGAKEEAIRSVFGLSAARYYQVVNAVIDSPEAVRHDPMLVGRLQRAREARSRARASRSLAAPQPPSSTARELTDETTD
jgi:hypothetical protein